MCSLPMGIDGSNVKKKFCIIEDVTVTGNFIINLSWSIVQLPDRSTFCSFLLCFFFTHVCFPTFELANQTPMSEIWLFGGSFWSLIMLFPLLTTGSSSSTPFSTPRQPLSQPLSLLPLPGMQSYRSLQTTRWQVGSSLFHLKLRAFVRGCDQVPVCSSGDRVFFNSCRSPLRCNSFYCERAIFSVSSLYALTELID